MRLNNRINNKIFTRKGMKIMLIILAIFAFCIFVFISLLLIYSPGKLETYLDKNGKPILGSISEKVFVNIGGVKQGMFIKGKNINNPVLLFVHGGPSFPEYFLFDKYPSGLEDYFTICYWEQRGGGLSYNSDIPIESMTFEKLTSDAIEVTNYLRKRFDKKKIYIMAHSGGTIFAIQAVQQSPELYEAYIGIAQITNQAESEKLAYKYMMDEYNNQGNKKAIEKLSKYPIIDSDTYILPFHKSLIRDKYMHELGIGTMRNMKNVFKDVFIQVWKCKAYTIKEKINIWESKFSFVKKTKLLDQLFKTDISKKILILNIPVYFFSGKYDLTVNHDLSKSYLEKLEAPVKGFYTFNESAHSPIFEEPQKVKEIMINDVLKKETTLADK